MQQIMIILFPSKNVSYATKHKIIIIYKFLSNIMMCIITGLERMSDNLFTSDDSEYVEEELTILVFDTMGLEGALVLKSIDGIDFPIVAFSGEVAQHIALFQQGKKNDIPTIYNLVEEIAVMHDLLLLEVRIYQSDSILRANLLF